MRKYIFSYIGYNNQEQLIFGQCWADALNSEIAYDSAVNWTNEQELKNVVVSKNYLVGEHNSVKEEVLPEERVTVFNSLTAEIESIAEFGLKFFDSMRRKSIQDICNQNLKIGAYALERTLN